MNPPKQTLTKAEIEDLRNLLVHWEDGNISDCEYCRKVGKILGMGGWTGKGGNR